MRRSPGGALGVRTKCYNASVKCMVFDMARSWMDPASGRADIDCEAGLMGTAPIAQSLSLSPYDHDMVTEAAPASVLPPPLALSLNKSQRSV